MQIKGIQGKKKNRMCSLYEGRNLRMQQCLKAQRLKQTLALKEEVKVM